MADTSPDAASDLVIVCCSADDRRWLVHLRRHIQAFARQRPLALWERGDVPAGARLREAVESAWARADAVVLLASPAFIAEDFAAGTDLHGAVLAAARRGLPILWIPASFSAYQHTELAAYQPLHDPERPLDGLEDSEVHRALVACCEKIVAAVPGYLPAPVRPSGPLLRHPRLHALGLRLRALDRRIVVAIAAVAVLGIVALAWRCGDDGAPTKPVPGDSQHAGPAAPGPTAPVPSATPSAATAPTTPPTALTAVPTLRLRSLPGGRFEMGSTPEEQQRFLKLDGATAQEDDERQHSVAVSPFEIGVTEVTNAEWKAVMGSSPSDCKTGCDDTHPVHGVSWDQALEFLNALTDRENAAGGEQRTPCYEYTDHAWKWIDGCTGYRLPTEAEWEYAARAGTTTAYSFGDDPKELCKHANGIDLAVRKFDPKERVNDQCDDGTIFFAAVGRHEPNAWGLHDMHGNVREWVWDVYFTPVRDIPPPPLTTDPRGPAIGLSRVLRGGSALDRPRWLRAASRQAAAYEDTRGDNGLRVARGVPSTRPEAIGRADCSVAGGCLVRWDGPKIKTIGGGAGHVCLVPTDGSLVCWGSNQNGKLGYGDSHERFLATGSTLFATVHEDTGGKPFAWPVPTARVAVGGVVAHVEGGTSHTCVKLADDPRVRCWGANNGGQLGYLHRNALGDAPGELPPGNVTVGGPVEHVVAGGDHTCAILEDATVRCWGTHPGHGLTWGATEDSPTPPSIPGVTAVEQMVAGHDHDCALLRDRTVRCWGSNGQGELGRGTTTNLAVDPQGPPPVDVGGPVVQLAAGDGHTCALLEGGAVRCWGANAYGQLGYGRSDMIGDQPGEMPPADVELRGKALQVVAGANHTCALLESRKVRCWGEGVAGQLGHGAREPIGDQPGEMPPPDVALGGAVDRLYAHLGSYTCALLEGGALRCWGRI